jgi:hypothetical protein
MATIKNKNIVSLDENEIFVFGSNRAGIHGAGAAHYAATHFGAVRGVGEGLTGRSYALPTKRADFSVCSLREIKLSLDILAETAKENHPYIFFLTRIGQGYAGIGEEVIKKLVLETDLPDNVLSWWLWEDQTNTSRSYETIESTLLQESYKLSEIILELQEYEKKGFNVISFDEVGILKTRPETNEELKARLERIYLREKERPMLKKVSLS